MVSIAFDTAEMRRMNRALLIVSTDKRFNGKTIAMHMRFESLPFSTKQQREMPD